MYRRFLGLATFTLCLAAATSSLAVSTSEDAALKRAVDRGQQIYAYDQAAWVSTDELLRQLPNARDVGVRGYVIEARQDLLRAIYYRLEGDIPRAVFWADVHGRTIVASHVLAASEDASVSAADVRMVQARSKAAAQAAVSQWAPCVPAPFNTVVLPPADAGAPVVVYLLTPQVKTGEFPFGGHYEVDVGADGRVVSSRPFSKSCLNMSPPPVINGQKPAAAFVTHLLDPTPTEIHVYLSLWMHEPVFVGTATTSHVWAVEGDRIRLVK